MLRPDILLHPNIPKPLHGISPREVYGSKWWDINRKNAYADAGYCCVTCGVPKEEAKMHNWLEAHEIYNYDYENGILTFREIVALCPYCHKFIHSGLCSILLKSGKLSLETYDAIMEHGHRILSKNGLYKEVIAESNVAWSDWKMIIDGNEYKSKFKDYNEWKHFYSLKYI